VVGPVEALERLVAAAADGSLDELCAQLGVRLLGAFGSARLADPSTAPHDLDVAVSLVPGSSPLALLDALVRLTDCDTIDLTVIDDAGPVVRAEALCGVGLHEDAPGAWAVAQMAALAEKRDTEWLRELDLQALAR